jgi:hypothetical protein
MSDSEAELDKVCSLLLLEKSILRVHSDFWRAQQPGGYHDTGEFGRMHWTISCYLISLKPGKMGIATVTSIMMYQCLVIKDLFRFMSPRSSQSLMFKLLSSLRRSIGSVRESRVLHTTCK